MAIREIIVDGDDRLRKVARPVDDVKAPRIQTLIEDMIDTLHESGNGIGLAAVQVGVLRRVFIVDLGDEKGLRVFVNPEITKREGSQCGQEGCLSVPGRWGTVERPARIHVRALDREGEPFELDAEGLEAVCICHENDHLDGILFTDKVIGELEDA